MKFYRYLYISDSLRLKKDYVLNKLIEGKLQKSCQLIILAANPENHLEIISSLFLCQPSFPKQDMLVVGVTKEYWEALEYIEQLTQIVYNETGRTNLRDYILEKEQDS